MLNTVETPGFIGFVGASLRDKDILHLSAEFGHARANVTPLPGSQGLIATFGNKNLDFKLHSNGIAAVSLGHLRQSGRSTPTLRGTTVADLICARFESGQDSIIHDLRGDYSLAVVDSMRERVLLAVDRVGIGTLFYGYTQNGTFVFATDLFLIRRLAAAQLSIDPQAIYDYTYYHAVPSPLTIYAEITKVPPGHTLVYADGAHSLERRWIPDFDSQLSTKQPDLEAELIDVMRSAVGRCVLDTNTGGFLSGGLDSSTICGMLREVAGRKVRAVSVGFDEQGYDEVSFANTAADHFDLEHIVHYMTPDEIADSVALIVENHAEPFGNSSVVPSYICALIAAQNGITTLLAGDGGDELFAGNTRYAKQKLFEYYLRLPAALRSGITDRLFDGPDRSWQLGPLRKIHRYVSQANIQLPHRLQTFNLLEMRQPDAVFCSDFLAAVDTGHPRQLLQDEYEAVDTDPVNRMLFSDWRFTLADNDLRKVTRTCQIAGVDVRFPLLDDEVLDFSIKIPANLKLKGLKLRYFYRHALRDYLPEAVLNKSKHGFGLPFGEWLKTSDRLQEMVNDALSSLRRRGIFNDSFIDSLTEAHRSQHAAFFGNMVWVLAMLEWWLAVHRPDYRM